MSEVKWTRRHDKFIKYEDINDETKNSIIICPPEMKIRCLPLYAQRQLLC